MSSHLTGRAPRALSEKRRESEAFKLLFLNTFMMFVIIIDSERSEIVENHVLMRFCLLYLIYLMMVRRTSTTGEKIDYKTALNET